MKNKKHKVEVKEGEKLDKYQDLTKELKSIGTWKFQYLGSLEIVTGDL